MQATIEVYNAQARLRADRGLIAQVRPLVAYKAVDLPPVEVQAIIKSFMGRQRTRGAVDDIYRLYNARGDQLRDIGWGQDTGKLTPNLWAAVLRNRGVWDGWKSLVSVSGYFGAGLVPHVQRALSLRIGIEPQIEDHREVPSKSGTPSADLPSVFDFQLEAENAWFAAGGQGVVNLPPRSGKTRIAIRIIMRLGLPALVVVPTVGLVAQTVAAFRQFMPDDQVIGVTGGRPSARAQRALNYAMVWVATPPTAAGPKPKNKRTNNVRRPGIQGIASRKVLVIDEFHHAAADTWQDISHAATEAYYRLGLTGTHYRADGKDLAMHAVLSRCVYRRSVTEMVDVGRLVPARVAMVRVDTMPLTVGGREAYGEGVVNCHARNKLIIDAANALSVKGRRVLVLTKEVRHAEVLAEGINGAVQVDGRDNSVVQGWLAQLQAGTIRCVVGTSVIGEGVDVPAADALIYAAGGRSRVKVVQDYFRVLTASAGKTHGIVIDFGDAHHPSLLDASAQRLALYRTQEAFTSEVIDATALAAWIDA